jgi:hypothetical protein
VVPASSEMFSRGILPDGADGPVVAINLSKLPKFDGLRGGSEPQPEDAQVGGWSRQRLEEMDGRFCARLTHAFERGDENKEAAAATIGARQR